MYTRTPNDHSTMLAGEVDGILFLITNSNVDVCLSRVTRVIGYNISGQPWVYMYTGRHSSVFWPTGNI
jgi:hypothetical protein